MEEEIKREKSPANPIPEEVYQRFKYKLEEHSRKYKDRNMMLFYLGVATGYRMQDLVPLTIGEIKDSLEIDKLVIQEKKQYEAWITWNAKNPDKKRRAPKPRIVVIEPKLRKILKEFIKGKCKSEYAFISNKGDGHITVKAYSAILSKVGKKMHLQNISGHSLRKTYATRLWIAKRDLEFVRLALGHKSIETTKVYLGLINEVKSSAAKIADDKL